MDKFDVIVVGGGPAGLSAGIVASLKGLKTAVFEGGSWGGLLSTIYPRKRIFNYPGTPSIRADHLVSEWVRQAADNKVHLIKERVVYIDSSLYVETTENQRYSAKAIIIATGMTPNLLGIPGEEKFSKRNRGVYPYVVDPEEFQDKVVLVVGGGDTAIDATLDLTSISKKIFLAHRRTEFRAAETSLKKVMNAKNVEILTETNIKEILGDQTVTGVKLERTHNQEVFALEVDRVILAVGLRPNTEIFASLNLEFNGKYLRTDALQRTKIPGIFAAGDIVTPYQLATVAAAQGALAAHGAYLYIREPYWQQEHLESLDTTKRQIL